MNTHSHTLRHTLTHSYTHVYSYNTLRQTLPHTHTHTHTHIHTKASSSRCGVGKTMKTYITERTGFLDSGYCGYFRLWWKFIKGINMNQTLSLLEAFSAS